MDSITQFVLGAACGEAVLGKKVGNRAMLWGAIGGTIPDLDVLANLFTDEITALAFHRGITHSLLFAILAPLAFGWLVYRLYDSDLYRRRPYKVGASIFWLSFFLLFVNFVPLVFGNEWNWSLFFWSGGILIAIGILLWLFYWRGPTIEVQATQRGWTLLFFWSIFTHPLLDSCTAYGTQLFQPFLDYRVAFNNIAVADPIYTLPYLICLLVVLFLARNNHWRRRLTWVAIGLSTLYIGLTFYNKYKVNQIFIESLAARQIQYERYSTTPTILNNALWNGLAEGDSNYYYGTYSLFDPEKAFLNIQEVPKQHELLAGHYNDRDISILRWFANDYYILRKDSTGHLMFMDLRYGSFNGTMDEVSDFIFRFDLDTSGEEWKASQDNEGPPIGREEFKLFWDRVFGRIQEFPGE
jgi:inner membrane protein